LNVAGAPVFFRSVNFYLPEFISLADRLGLPISEHSFKFILPVGLAYYTLQNISYLVDVRHKQIAASVDFIDFALYLAYFPKLLSGPIERARTFLPQLANPRRVDNETLARSFTLIIVGLLRKLLIASLFSGILFWNAFETPALYTAPELIGWIVIYGLFLYNDFAGYTSIVRGISGLFGIQLSHNFKQPYFARNLTEFWNNWHISLSHWLRDYIFFPSCTRSNQAQSKSKQPAQSGHPSHGNHAGQRFMAWLELAHAGMGWTARHCTWWLSAFSLSKGLLFRHRSGPYGDRALAWLPFLFWFPLHGFRLSWNCPLRCSIGVACWIGVIRFYVTGAYFFLFLCWR
jgi:hypothetical protein